MAKKVSVRKVEAAVGELDKVRRSWLRRPGVTAVDVGFKITDQKLTDQVAVRVHVKRKLHDRTLERDHEAFSTAKSPEKCGDFPVDVIEAEYGPNLIIEELEAVNRKTRIDPLVGGISVGNPRVTAGTLGAVVWDRTDCKVSILSNWHVLCGSTSCVAGEDIYQPGVFDGGTAADTIGKLKRFMLDNHNDSALAELNGSRGSTRDIVGLNPIPGVIAPTLGMNVTKSGRTTNVTEGIIDGVSLSTSINYGGVVNAFTDQIHIVPKPPWPAVNYELSKGGDSGSVWIDQASGKAVGLHFAGETDPSPSAENAIANQMVHVAADLNFSFTPLFCPVRVPIDHDLLRRIIWQILCRRYPWLCGRWPTPNPPVPGTGAGPNAIDESLAGCNCQPGVGEAWAGQYGSRAAGDVVDEIIAQIEAAYGK